LSDREIAGALGLTRSEGDLLRPTVAGLLLVGKESALRDHVPAHEVAFQVLRGTDVQVNEFRRWPLLRVHEWLTESIGVRNEEQELMVGSARIGVPRYDRAGLREAISNALIHRDYTRLGAVHVQLRGNHVRVSSPGGFVEGVTPDNLLVTEPRPRNPRLADAFKRAGLVERTGRGVETINRGQLRNGRRPPDYSLSTPASVSVILDSGPTDLDFVMLVVRAGRQLGQALNVVELLALRQVRRKGVATASDLAPVLQRDASHAGSVLARLAQTSLLEADGVGYQLSGKGFPAVQACADPEDAILAQARQHGRVTRGEVMDLCQVSARQATYLLRKLVAQGVLVRQGVGRGTFYAWAKTNK
jgi:ATP-dependent DNA helicase RecG